MWSRQIFVAILCTFLASQQVAAVVNNGQSAKSDASKKNIAEDDEANKSSSKNDVDQVSANTDSKANRREAPLALGDTYGPPALTVNIDSYPPSGPTNVNLPVPVYGVPDAPTNNIVYPAPPPDIPPPVALPPASYAVSVISNTYGAPAPVTYLPPENSYGPPQVQFEGIPLSPPKLFGGGRGTKPPRPQYGPPSKSVFPSKFPLKYPHKSGVGVHKHTKPLPTYGPPSGYFKDNYSPSKFNVKYNNIFSDASALSHSTFTGQLVSQYAAPAVAYGAPNGLYGVPNVGIQTHSSNLNVLSDSGHGISNQYGAPEVQIQILQGNSGHNDHSISTQYGSPSGDILGPPKHRYGPPQPSPHPKPPHPGAPAPPTPPDIKYDGWQPIPGLVSRVPTASYGVPPSGGHSVGNFNDLIPPPLAQEGYGHSSGGSESYGGSHGSVSDSYGAPLNTVTGSGGIVSSSGEAVHGQHESHSGTIDIDIGHGGGSSGKGIGIDIYSTGSGSLGGDGHSSGGYNLQIGDTYSAPPLNSHSSTGPYAAGHSHNNFGSSSLGFGSHGSHVSHNSYNSYKSHGHKTLSISNSGRGLIPPSGVYGAIPSNNYGTPLFANNFHGPPLNALKINPPKHPVVHREPIPPGFIDSVTQQGSHKHIHGHGFSSSYLPSSILDTPKGLQENIPPFPTTLYSLPNVHSSISFQNVAHGSSTAGLLHENFANVGATGPVFNSYNAPLNIVDGSYNLPQTQSHLQSHIGGTVVGLDLSHPTLTIDLTDNARSKHSFPVPQDCNLQKTHSLPSPSYGVPSANGYAVSDVSLSSNVGGAHALAQTYGPSSLGNTGPSVDISYQVSETHSEGDDYDLSAAHSQKVSSKANINLINEESQGKAYGKSVAESFGPHSELVQSQSIDLNNIPVQGALGSYTLQIQSADGSQSQVAHSQVLNEGLLQSILAAIEKPDQSGQSIIKLQKSLEKQNYVTNASISSVVEKVADEQIEHSSPVHYVVEPSNEVLSNVNEQVEERNEDEDLPLVEDNGVALYFSNNHRSKKETDKDNAEERSNENIDQSSH